MAFLASLLVYLGTVSAVVLALVMSATAFLTPPNSAVVSATRPIAALAIKPVKAAAVTHEAAAVRPAATLGRWGPRVAPQIKSAAIGPRPHRQPRLAAEASRRRYLYLARQQRRAARVAYQQEPMPTNPALSYAPGLDYAADSTSRRSWVR